MVCEAPPILEGNKGRLTIISHSGSSFLKGDRIKTFDKLPVLSWNSGGTTIDFQLNYLKSISIAQALKGHEPVEHRIENLQDDSGSIYYKLSEQSSGTGTKKSGERIRNDIINIIRESGVPV